MSDLNDVAGAVDVDTSVAEAEHAAGATDVGVDATDIPIEVGQEDIDASHLTNNKWYEFRIASAVKGVSKSGGPKLTFRVICQDEPHTGQSLLYVCSLQRHALFSLEALFKATKFKAQKGWTAGQLYDRTFQGFVETKSVEGRELQQITKMKPSTIAG